MMSDTSKLSQALAKLHHKDWRVRERAVEDLETIGTERATQAIVETLDDEIPHVARRAAKALQKTGVSAVQPLLDALRNPNNKVHRRIILALGRIGDLRAVPDLVDVLQNKDASLRIAAARALGQLGDTSAVPHLIQALQDEESHVRGNSAEALGQIEDKHAAAPLLRILREDEDKVTRRKAALALSRLGDDGVSGLSDALQDKQNFVRASAAEALGRTRRVEFVPDLMALLQDDDEQVRYSAVFALGWLGNTQAVPQLIEMLNDEDRHVVGFAFIALGATGDLRSVPFLMERLRRDPHGSNLGLYSLGRAAWDWEEDKEQSALSAIKALESHTNQALRVSAVWLLCSLSSEYQRAGEAEELNDQHQEPELYTRATEALINALSDDNPDVRLSATYPLIRFGDARAVPSLVQALYDEDEMVSLRAGRTLGHIGDASAVPGLLKALNDPKVNTHRSIINTLGTIGDASAVQALLEALHHPDSNIRESAAFALGNIGDESAVPALLEALRGDPDQEARRWIVIGLGRIGDPRAVPDLVDVLNKIGPDPRSTSRLRHDAAYALYRIADEAAVPGLYKAINGAPDWQVRSMAVRAIGKIGDVETRVARLFELLHHEVNDVRSEAATSLGYIGAKLEDLELRDRIVSNLIQLLSDTDYAPGHYAVPTTAHAASRSLYYIGTTEAFKAIELWQQHGPSDQEGHRKEPR